MELKGYGKRLYDFRRKDIFHTFLKNLKSKPTFILLEEKINEI